MLDVARKWAPPFNPSQVIAEAAALLKSYGLTTACGDRYAGGFVSEGFAAHNIRYEPSSLDRSQIYLELLPLVNARQAVLLDRPDLLKELRGLERRRGTTRDRVDHRSRQHDDLANSAAIALTRAASAATQGGRMVDLVECSGSGEPDNNDGAIYVSRDGQVYPIE